jgi:virulence factor Mce-like protein
MRRLLSGPAHTVIARLSALVLAGLLVASAGGYAVLHFGLLDHGPEYRAEFLDAWPLVAGMDVRVSGAVAGQVRKVALTDRGTAEVTFQLDPGVPQPRADASVAIRQDDLLGDTDLSLSLGTSARPLQGPIPVARSIQEPRLDDFLNIFQAPVRAALKTFIVELGTALENRGVDVNAAILKLRPGFEALGSVFDELHSQIGALRQVIDNSHALTSQLASRTRDLGQLVSGLSQTLGGVATNSRELDSGLAQLPHAITATRTTLSKVQSLAASLHPLASTVATGAPGFQRAAGLIGPYAGALSRAASLASPTIRLAGEALRRSAPSLSALRKTSFAALLNPTSGLFGALSPILSRLANGLFGSTKGGGLGGTVLPGNDFAAPNVDPARDYLSAYLVISCELFGVRQEPGCLSKILQTYASPSTPAIRRREPSAPAGGAAHAPARSASPPSAQSASAATVSSPSANPTPVNPPTPASRSPLSSLLDYLLRR